MQGDIEILDETVFNKQEENSIIPLDRLFDEKNENTIDVYEESKEEEKRNQKKITNIQIGLIIFLIIFATIFYLFGYNLVEPFIKID